MTCDIALIHKEAPRRGADPVEPAWKSFPEFSEVVPPRAPAARGDK